MNIISRISKPKLAALIAIAAVVVGAAAVAVIFFFSRTESYRMIKVVALDGTAVVLRDKVGDIDAYIGMNLQSGDSLRLDEKSTTTIMLDDDKYILLEPGTVLTVEAYGNEKNNRTTINLECGAILNTITGSLTENSSYVVNVPNAVMAVRGTCYRVSVTMTGEDKYEIGLEVFSGKVESRLLDENGKPVGENKMHEKNTSTVIVSDGKGTDGMGKAYYLVIDDEIDFDSLPTETVNMIMDIYYSGHAPLEDTVAMLIRHSNKDAVEYLKNHKYSPTGTLTGTAPDLGDLTAVSGDDAGKGNDGSSDGAVKPDDDPTEPVGADGTGLINAPDDNSDNPDAPNDSGSTSAPDAADNPREPNNSDARESRSAPNSDASDVTAGQNNTPASGSRSVTTSTVSRDNNSIDSIFGNNNPYNPTVTLPQSAATPPSYTAVFLDPDGVVIN